MDTSTKNIILVILSLVVLIYIIRSEDRIGKLKSEVKKVNTLTDIELRETILDYRKHIQDSLIEVLDATKLPKKPDTVYIIKDVIKYEKSKNAILDSTSKYQYTWSNYQLDSMYAQ